MSERIPGYHADRWVSGIGVTASPNRPCHLALTLAGIRPDLVILY